MAGPELRVNKEFAQRYRAYRRREELQRLQDRYGDTGNTGSSSESSSSEDEEVSLDPRLEKEFYRTLALLKTRDPRIYQQDSTFYSQPDSASSEEEDEEDEEPPAKPMYLKDYERKVVLEKEGKYVDEEEEEDEEAAAERRKRVTSRSYVEEQQQLKESFQAFLAESEEEEEEEAGEGSALLRPRRQTAEEKEKEEEDYLLWLKGQGEAPPEPLQELVPLRQYWSDPALEPGERFLRDYLLNQAYKEQEEEEDEEEAKGVLSAGLADSSDEGELFLAKQEEFERRWNFRYEEPGGEKVQSYPRKIVSSVRRRDERRKERREKIRERKRKEKLRKQEELKQLKKLKREELSWRLAQLQEASGTANLCLPHSFLQQDFEPALHDQMMAECFGEDYYGQEEEEKPHFEEEEEGLEDDWNWDSWTGSGQQEEEEEEERKAEPHCEDPDFVMDADYPPAAPQAPLGKKRRGKTRFREALEREKPTFDPGSSTFEQYLEEFYQLDYEDLIGDLPCRFKYRSVVPCDFGLSTEEILAADDKELNRWCSLRKTCMYRSEQEERQDQANYSRRAQNPRKKQQILKSLVAGPEEPKAASPSKAKLGKKGRGKRKRLEEEEEKKGDEALGSPKPPPEAPKRRGGVPKRGGVPLSSSVRLGGQDFTGKRLEAFGLNPRRLRFRQLQRRRKRRRGQSQTSQQ